MNTHSSETVFAISYTIQHSNTSLTALGELDNRVANEYVLCCSNQHMGAMTVNPDPPLALCSLSIHECVKPWDLLQLSSSDALSPADSLFVFADRKLGEQRCSCGHSAATLMTRSFPWRAGSLVESASTVSTC